MSGKGDAAWILFMTANLELVAKVGSLWHAVCSKGVGKMKHVVLVGANVGQHHLYQLQYILIKVLLC